VNSRDLPAAEREVQRTVPAVAEPPAAAERQLVDVARHEAVADIELGGAAFGLKVVAVLRLAEDAGVHAGAAAARGDVVRGFGERLPERVADHPRQPL
jgi:hypothetical protein